MSTQTRSGGGGRNQSNKKVTSSSGGGGNDTAHKKTDHSKTEKEKPHVKQPTAEQIRIAQITEIGSGTEDPKMREKVASLMETTQRSEEEVCCALYECDNDLDRAVIFLLETLPVGAFETSSKKKKNRLAGVNDTAGADGDWVENNNAGSNNNANNNNNSDARERSRNRGNARPGRGGTDSRGWRGRESRENDRNSSNTTGTGGAGGGENRTGEKWQGQGGPPRRGPPGGFRSGGFGSGRGGRNGGRLGSRGLGSRDQNRTNYFRSQEPHETVDTWDNTIATSVVEQNKSDDTWGDWDNEEYTGSLADTKVFTPSTVQNQTLSHSDQLSAPPGLEQQILNPPSQLTDDLVQQYSSTVVSSTATAAAVVNNNNNQVQYSDIHVQSTTTAPHLRQALDISQLNSSSLSAEQSQYFNSLSSQNSAQQQQQQQASNLVNSYQPVASVQYSSSPYVSNNNYADQVVAGQQQVQSVGNRNKRARVPPPSKIPSTAVEMPVDTLNNIGYLDVQFGGLDFGTEESFDAISEKFQAASIVDNSQNVASGDVSTDYQQKSAVQQSSTGGLQQQQLIQNTESLSSQNDNLTVTGYNQRQSSSVVSSQTPSVANTLNNASAALEQLTKSDHYTNQTTVNATSVSGSGANAAGSYQTYTNKSAGVYQQSNVTPQAYSNSNYSNTQASSGTNYPAASNTYSSYNPATVNSYQPQQQSNNVNNSSSTTSVANSGAVQNIPVGSSSSVNNSSSSTNSGYLSNQYPGSQTSSAYPSQSNAYQNNQSVYGNSGLNNNAGYTGNTNTSTSQYSNFSGTKLSKDTTPVTTIYDSTLSSSAQNVASNNSASSTAGNNNNNSMSSPSLGLTNTKVTNSTAKSTGTGSVVSNIPMVSQYIQTGMPFYQQPVYSYEDIQMLQQRIPPHVPGYYDINYQTPTSLGAAGVRDANLGSVAYSTMSDGRFARTDNNSSPVSNVPSTMSQQTGSGGPMLNLPYAYFYGANMMPGSFQYGTPALYPQQMATANASSGAQFPKPSYNSGYGSTGYDTLSQTAQDYNKSAYPGSGGQQSKGQNVSNPPPSGTGSDITSSMYGKSHVALNKVNSYEKQSFHSGTPPPFNLAGTQTAGATSQAYGAQQLYIQAMPAALHNMNMHQQIHQDSNSSGQRQPSSSQGKSGTKQGYSPSYWTAQN